MQKPKSKKKPWQLNAKAKTKREGLRHNQSLYSSAKWRRKRREILNKEPLCRECKKENKITEATIVDHIQPISVGGKKFDNNNLQPLCETHHNRKTAKELMQGVR